MYRAVDQTDEGEMVNLRMAVNQTDENEMVIDVNIENTHEGFDDDERLSSDVESLLVS